MKTEIISLNEERDVTLTAYLLGTGGSYRHIDVRPALLILPGGGYQYCSEQEADPTAMRFLGAGFQVFVLDYSVAEHAEWPHPLEDYEQAMELIRERADEWRLDPERVAVLGFSAGGHLASAAATMSVHRPAAAILGYAVTRQELIKECVSNAPDTVSQVNRYTCPCFIFATRDDGVVAVENSLQFAAALAEHGISFESHIYAFGPHGYSTGDHSAQYPPASLCSRASHWVDDSVAWLRDVLGDFGFHRLSDPVCPKYVSGDYEEYLSDRCTFGYLRNLAQAEELMGPFIEWVRDHMDEISQSIGPAAHGRTLQGGFEGFCTICDSRTLAEILRNTGLSEEEKEKLTSALKAVRNAESVQGGPICTNT